MPSSVFVNHTYFFNMAVYLFIQLQKQHIRMPTVNNLNKNYMWKIEIEGASCSLEFHWK